MDDNSTVRGIMKRNVKCKEHSKNKKVRLFLKTEGKAAALTFMLVLQP